MCCNNSKKVCKKICVREEKLLKPLLEYLDKIQLPDALIEDIINYLKQSFTHEQNFFKDSQEKLRKELDLIQGRLSKLIDMHLDGTIDSDAYHEKLEEYKKRQREITSEMINHIDADENCLITAKTVLHLAKHAKEIFILKTGALRGAPVFRFMSSKLSEKQQFLNLLFSNLKLEGEKLLVTLRKPFSTLMAVSHQPKDLRVLDSNQEI